MSTSTGNWNRGAYTVYSISLHLQSNRGASTVIGSLSNKSAPAISTYQKTKGWEFSGAHSFQVAQFPSLFHQSIEIA
jgi:hypothetical protein